MSCPAVLPIDYPGLFTRNVVQLQCGKTAGHKGRHTCSPPTAMPIGYPKESKPLITWV